MAVRIRLSRFGRKKKPFYRIVVQNAEASRDGKFLDMVGTYDPMQDPIVLNIKQDKVQAWLDKGAQPTTTVKSLLARNAVAPVAAPAAE
jgi:small subunit ribosomal protein S16